MATEVKLPDLGEGIEDATISRWLHQEGDDVEAGEVLLEVATDKVDTEVPAPAGGKLLKINHKEGELVQTGAVLGLIGAAGEEAGASDEPAQAKPKKAAKKQPEAAPEAKPEPEAEAAQPSSNGQAAKASPVAKRVAADKGVALDSVSGSGPGGRITKDDVLASAGDGQEAPAPDKAEDKAQGGKQAPAKGAANALPGDLADTPTLAVRREAALANINLDDVAQGRPLSSLTRYDVMSAVASRAAGEEVTILPAFAPPAGWTQSQAAPAAKTEKAAPAAEEQKPAAQSSRPAPEKLGAGEVLVKHSRMRQIIARNMVESAFTAPHVTTMWDVNMTAALAHRAAHKDEFAQAGVNLTVTAYLVAATVAGLQAVPAANSEWTDEGVLIKRTINLGMAVALPVDENGLGGLIVPVIKNAGDLNLMGIAKAVNDLANRARANQLRSEDLQDGTFSLTNYGTGGSRFQTPVIMQPQVGILGVGAIEKRAVVVSQGHPLEANTGDYLAFLPMTTLGFSYDHRVLDGATADLFCKAVKDALEGWS